MAKKLKITQVKSKIGSQDKKHKRTMLALGLRRNYRTVYQSDSPEIIGMLRKISHLVKWEEIHEKDIPKIQKSSNGLTMIKEVDGARVAKGDKLDKETENSKEAD